MKASYTKLNDGSWGIRIPDGADVVIGGKIQAGAVAHVTTKAGERKMEAISRVIWSGNGVTLCAIMPAQKSEGRYRDDRDAHERRYQVGF